jgi:hypothetical protein
MCLLLEKYIIFRVVLKKSHMGTWSFLSSNNWHEEQRTWETSKDHIAMQLAKSRRKETEDP